MLALPQGKALFTVEGAEVFGLDHIHAPVRYLCQQFDDMGMGHGPIGRFGHKAAPVVGAKGLGKTTRLYLHAPVAESLAQTAGTGKLVQLQARGFPLQRSWSVVRRLDHPLSAAAKRFVSYLQEVPGQLKSRLKRQAGHT